MPFVAAATVVPGSARLCLDLARQRVLSSSLSLSLPLPLTLSFCCSFRSVRVVNALLSSRLCFACCAARLPLTVSRFDAVRSGTVRCGAGSRYPLCYCVLCALALAHGATQAYAASASLQDQCRSRGLIPVYLFARLCSTCCRCRSGSCLTYYNNYSFATLCHCVHIVLDCCVYLDLKHPYPKSGVSLSLFQFKIIVVRFAFPFS